MNQHELKALQVQLAKAKATVNVRLSEKQNADMAYVSSMTHARMLEEKLKRAETEPLLTEHALLRYIERVYEIDLDALRKSIMTPETIRAIKVIGSGKYPLPAGGKAVIKNNTIVSITD